GDLRDALDGGSGVPRRARRRDEQAAGPRHRGSPRRAPRGAHRRAPRDGRVRGADALDLRGAREGRGMKRFARAFWPPIAVLVLGLVALEAYVRARNTPIYLVPRPSQVLSALIDERSYLLAALWITTKAALIGFLLSAALGIALALALASSP